MIDRGVVHLTSHPCRVLDAAAEYPSRDRTESYWPVGGGWSLCGYCRKAAPRFTTDPAAATCKTCLRKYEGHAGAFVEYPYSGSARTHTWLEVVEATVVACCRHRGATDPRPASAVMAAERGLRALSVRAAALLFGRLIPTSATWLGVPGGLGAGAPSFNRDDFWRAFAFVLRDAGPAEKALLAPLVKEMRALVDELDAVAYRGRDIFDRAIALSAHVETRGLVAVPEVA